MKILLCNFQFLGVQRAFSRFHQERFRRRLPFEFNGQPSFVLTAEDVILSKLRWSRVKDIEDVRDVMAVKGEAALDWTYLNRWADSLGFRAKLDTLRSEIPKID